MRAALAVWCGLLGLMVGSFVNVVAWRAPRGESVARPRSRCPSCLTPIAARDNVPVVSWLLLGRRCRTCREPISVRYPLVEAVAGLLYLTAAVVLGFTWALPAHLVLIAALLAVALIDLDHGVVPSRVALVATGLTVAAFALSATAGEGWGRLGRALLAGAAATALVALAHRLWPRRVPAGHIPVAALVGLRLGWA